jgi:hypothetical protein
MDRDAVWNETYKQFRKSIGTKLLLFVVALGALAVLVRLDRIRLELKNTREKPYQAALASAAFARRNPVLKTAADRLQAAGYVSADALFDALYAKTPWPEKREHDIQVAFSKYAKAVGERNAAIHKLAAEPSASDKPAQLEQEIARRDSLIEIRTMEVEQIEHDAAQRKAELQKGFDAAAIPRHKFSFFSNDALNSIGQRFADADDPVSVVFDILWYAALIVAVISIVALILTPVFRALPVAGTEEKFWDQDQIKSLLGKTPRVVRGITSIAAVAVGAAAVVATAVTARSSPAKDARVFVRRAYTPPVPKDPPSTLPSPAPDPRVDRLLTEVASLHDTDADHERRLTDQGKELREHGQALSEHALAMEPLKPLPGRLVLVENWLNGFEPAENRRIAVASARTYGAATQYADGKIRDVRDSLEFQIDGTNERVKQTENIVKNAAGTIEKRADTITDGVFQPYLIGDRPSALKTLLGFDRYRATGATELILKENKADDSVLDAVAALRRTNKTYTQSEFLRTLRVWTCHDQHKSCDAYLNWQALVLRTARM